MLYADPDGSSFTILRDGEVITAKGKSFDMFPVTSERLGKYDDIWT